jgi:hypothetical protein
VGLDTAQEMIAEVRSLALVRGWRGLTRGDTDALARAVVSMSQLALLPGQPVSEAEANPVIVQPDGVTAVDGLVVLRATFLTHEVNDVES